MLRRLVQLVLCVAAITLGVWVGEWVHPSPAPSPPAPTRLAASPAPSQSTAPGSAPSARSEGFRSGGRGAGAQPPPYLVVRDQSPVATWPDSATEAGWASVDARARTESPEAASVPRLARWLVQGARTDREKARAIFVWITEHVAYRTGIDPFHPPFEAPEDVLRARVAICGGYARLFNALAAEAGMKAELVGGYARTAATGGRPYGVADGHAWNAIEIDGGWYLVDCTWGAGSVEDGRFEKSFQPFYFLTPPRLFAYTHFPKQSRWQLLASPLSLDAHRALPLLTPRAWALGVALDAREAVDARQGTASFRFVAPEDVRLKATLRPLATPRGSGEESEPGTVLLQRRGTQCDAEIAAPGEGDFRLDIYAGSAVDDTHRLDLAASVTVRSGKSADARLVTSQGAALPRGAHLSPSVRDLRAGTTQRFEVHVPYSKGIFVRNGERRQTLEGTWPTYAGDVLLERGSVAVCAEVGEDRYVVLAEYEAR